jgi:hypothetical protein
MKDTSLGEGGLLHRVKERLHRKITVLVIPLVIDNPQPARSMNDRRYRIEYGSTAFNDLDSLAEGESENRLCARLSD